MTTADEYRKKAAQFRARATNEKTIVLRQSFEALAAVYMRLAEQADRNAETDISYGPILPPRDDGTEPSARQAAFDFYAVDATALGRSAASPKRLGCIGRATSRRCPSGSPP